MSFGQKYPHKLKKIFCWKKSPTSCEAKQYV